MSYYLVYGSGTKSLLTSVANSNPVPAMVQHVMGGSNPTVGGTPLPGNNFKFTLPESVGTGNLLLLGLNYTSGSTLSSISDTINGSWSTTPLVSADAGAGNMKSGLWAFPNAGSGITKITVSFSGNVNNFQYDITEFSNIVTTSPSNGTATSGASPVTGASLSTGSFTPGDNDANGGNLIYAYFACSNVVASGNPSNWAPGGSFSLLNGDIAWISQGLPHSAQYFVQSSHASINPSTTATGDTADTFNCVAVALKAANAGTPRPAGMRIVSIFHFSTESFPTGSGTYVMLCPTIGNLRYITGTDPSTTIGSVTDSESNSFTHITAIGDDNHWYFPQAVSNNALKVTLHVTSGQNKQSWRFVDFIGAANVANPVDVTGDVSVPLDGATTMNNAPTLSPTSATGGIMICNIGLGQGPGTGFNTGAPTNAVFDLVNYTNEVDTDNMDNADLMGHAHYGAGGGTFNWNWTMTSQTHNSAQGGGVAFKSA